MFFRFRNKIKIRNVKKGKNVKIYYPSNIYGCKLDDEVFIGPFVEIQSNVTIGKGTRIQSHSFICDQVEIGKNCFIGHGVMFINDLLRNGPAQGDKSKYRKTKIGDNVSIGSNSTILPVTICDNVVIGAGSVVTKDILKPGVYAGNPTRLLRESN